MSEMASEYENPSLNSVQHTLDCSEPAGDLGAALGSSQALLSICTLPPIQTITEAVPNDPSPLTTSATTADSETFQRSVSARRVEYDVTDDGVVISVPVTSDIPNSNNNNGTYEDGYDSDGQLGPFYDAVLNEKDDDDEEFIEEEQRPLNEVSDDSVQQEPHEIAPEANLPNFQLMTVAQLKDELRKRNLPVHGRKELLLQRLSAPPAAIYHTTNSGGRLPQQPTNTINGFAPHAKWIELKHHQERLVEPNQQHPSLVGPTVPTGQAEAPKYNFNEQFDRPPFTALATVVKQNRNGRPVFDRQGRAVYEQVIREDGCANIEWLKQNKLTKDSRPSDWINALLPLKKKIGDLPCTVSIDEWTSYTNLRAILMNAGSCIYSGQFKPFTPLEIRSFLALYILQGLSPSPQIKMKFVPQALDPINGSDMCFRVFGRNTSKRHKEFKAFFTIQDPRKIVPPRTTHPNFKIDPFLRWIQVVSMAAFDLGRLISIDEQTIGFKGHHADKMRISYKKEGDGFQCDAICCDGYTYSFFMRNMPAPKKYLDKGLSPLHARCLFLLDQLKDKHHVCGVDNLYTSARFFREAFTEKNKVLCHGVARKSGRGVPKCVIQEEPKRKTQQDQMRGTTKAAVLTDDPEIQDLVAFSVYDTKPVHFLSMACTGLKWIEKRKKVFERESSTNVSMAFLRPEVTDLYNNGMNNVDIADQLRGTYRFDRWMRKRKWWWSIWMWGVQVLLVNAYVLYRTAHSIIWKTEKKKILTQYRFREEIVKAWMEGEKSDSEGQKKRKLSENQVSTYSSTSESLGRTRSSVTSIQSEVTVLQRGRKINDKTLDPTSGDLKIRLDADFHYPIPPGKNKYPPCSLCRWALQDGTSRNNRVRGASISTCDKCNVSLCLSCFKPFHTVTSVDKLRSEVKKNEELKRDKE
jgi:hypothetical protein